MTSGEVWPKDEPYMEVLEWRSDQPITKSGAVVTRDDGTVVLRWMSDYSTGDSANAS